MNIKGAECSGLNNSQCKGPGAREGWVHWSNSKGYPEKSNPEDMWWETYTGVAGGRPLGDLAGVALALDYSKFNRSHWMLLGGGATHRDLCLKG